MQDYIIIKANEGSSGSDDDEVEGLAHVNWQWVLSLQDTLREYFCSPKRRGSFLLAASQREKRWSS